ncbi:hypothetical protein NLJ89_g403 [Agrocybe chaxingu]|uniref:Uncharacterized protein n=1 Tax=Agrocybe chaxingu TaxID=84603 RepID=A0A9W8N1Z8_9AGAR|nr:hypothetical protein NLJ89_g403 [Agrocybe chaxingu]
MAHFFNYLRIPPFGRPRHNTDTLVAIPTHPPVEEEPFKPFIPPGCEDEHEEDSHEHEFHDGGPVIPNTLLELKVYRYRSSKDAWKHAPTVGMRVDPEREAELDERKPPTSTSARDGTLYAPPYANPAPAQTVNSTPHSIPDFAAVPRALAAAPPANFPAMKACPDGMSAYLDYGIPVTRRKQEETQSSTVDIPDDHGSCTGEEASENASPPKEPMAALRELEDVMAELDGEAMKDIALEIYRMLTEGQGAMSSVQ